MEITVKKPTEAEKREMLKMPVWGCEASKFDWHYDSAETCLLTEGEVTVTYNGGSVSFVLTEGEVTVTYNGGSVSFGAGDYVTFPKGLSCVWDVSKPVKKHYIFH